MVEPTGVERGEGDEKSDGRRYSFLKRRKRGREHRGQPCLSARAGTGGERTLEKLDLGVLLGDSWSSTSTSFWGSSTKGTVKR